MHRKAAGLLAVAMAAGAGTAATADGATVIKTVGVNSGTKAAMYAPVTINGRTVLLLVDTGATNTSIDSRLVKRLKLKRAGKPAKVGTVGCKSKVKPVAIGRWRIGSAALPPTIVNASRQAGKLKRILGLPVAGLLGNDALASFGTVSVDFADRRLVLGGRLPFSGYALKTKRVVNKKTGKAAAFAAAVRIKKRKKILLVDTGASQSTLTRSVARKLKLRKSGKPKRISAVSCKTRVRPFRLPRLTSGSVTFDPSVALGTKTTPIKGAAGLLGAPALATYGQASFDYRSGAVVLGFPSP